MAMPLYSDLAATLEGGPSQQIAQHLGITSSQASTAIATALPLLLGALGRNASQPQGAQALFGALQRDHSGQDVGNVLGSVLDGGGQGSQILGHVFGDRTPRAEQAVGQTTGIGQDKAHLLLRWLAPVAMAYVAKRVFDRHQAAASDASTAPSVAAPASPRALGIVLGQEAEHAQRQSSGLLGAVLDRDDDGKVDFADLLEAGGSALGGLGQQPRHLL